MTSINTNQLLEKVETFYDQYLYLKDIHNVYLDIDSAFEEADKAKTFFSVAASACIDSYEMTVARLFDTHKGTETVNSLIGVCRQNITLFSDQQTVVDVFVAKQHQIMLVPLM